MISNLKNTSEKKLLKEKNNNTHNKMLIYKMEFANILAYQAELSRNIDLTLFRIRYSESLKEKK